MPLSVWSASPKSVRSTRSVRSRRRRRKYRVKAVSTIFIVGRNILASGAGWFSSKTSSAVRWTTGRVWYGWIFHRSISQAKALLYWMYGQYIITENNTSYLITQELVAIIFAIFCMHVARFVLKMTLNTFTLKPKPEYFHIMWDVETGNTKRTRSGRSYGGGDINIAKRTRSGCVYGYM